MACDKALFILLDQNQHMHCLDYLDPEALLSSDFVVLNFEGKIGEELGFLF